MRAVARADFCFNLFVIPRFFVSALTRKRVKHIRDGNQTGKKWNLFALQTLFQMRRVFQLIKSAADCFVIHESWIAFAIPTLMVIHGHIESGLLKLTFAIKVFCANDRVPLHQPIFNVVQLARLFQNCVRNSNLANVVRKCGKTKHGNILIALVRRHAHVLGKFFIQVTSNTRHALHMGTSLVRIMDLGHTN